MMVLVLATFLLVVLEPAWLILVAHVHLAGPGLPTSTELVLAAHTGLAEPGIFSNKTTDRGMHTFIYVFMPAVLR